MQFLASPVALTPPCEKSALILMVWTYPVGRPYPTLGCRHAVVVLQHGRHQLIQRGLYGRRPAAQRALLRHEGARRPPPPAGQRRREPGVLSAGAWLLEAAGSARIVTCIHHAPFDEHL